MALRQILQDGDPALRKKSRPVTKFDDRLRMLIDDMLDTMYKNNGIGLAAPQVGVLRRLFVIDLQDEKGPYVMINPRFIKQEGTQVYSEACLSVPGFYGDVERPERLVVEAQDRDGKTYTMEAEELLAVCICHEYDHLDGILFKDKVKGALYSQ